MSRNLFSLFSTATPKTTDVSVSPRDPRTGKTVDTGTPRFSPVARNAIVHPVRTAPERTSFVLDYQI